MADKRVDDATVDLSKQESTDTSAPTGAVITEKSVKDGGAGPGGGEKRKETPAVPTPQTAKDSKAATAQDSEDEDGNEVLEESPCGRWQKRREQVRQRDVPGIDAAYLAMDSEEGVEVVWNEVQFSERKNFRAKEEKIKAVFDNLIHLQHCNLVKFHKYWTDASSDKPRVVFITEYMSSGSMSQFLKTARQSNSALSARAWKKWCTQILSALNYLHSCDPPIIHGNLTCNTIFIQHNGLVKIGCVAPDAIHHHVKTFRENMKSMHYVAPEYEIEGHISPATDIYSYGMCALEMALLGLSVNGENAPIIISQDVIEKKIESLECPLQQDFIRKCLAKNPLDRPTARELLFHAVLFEVHSLKLLAAHIIVNNPQLENESTTAAKSDDDQDRVLAEIVYEDPEKPALQTTLSKVQTVEVDKLLEDVKNGIYPLTAFAVVAVKPALIDEIMKSSVNRQQDEPTGVGGKDGKDNLSNSNVLEDESRSGSPIDGKHHQTSTTGKPGADGTQQEAEKLFVEIRRIIRMSAEAKKAEAAGSADPAQRGATTLTLILRFEDNMNRHLTCEMAEKDTAAGLSEELVLHGFIHADDCGNLQNLISDALRLLDARTQAAAAEREAEILIDEPRRNGE